MKGDEVCRRLMADPATAEIPVVYVSGFGSDLQPDRAEIPNVKGSISKPFTSETLINAVRSYLPRARIGLTKLSIRRRPRTRRRLSRSACSVAGGASPAADAAARISVIDPGLAQAKPSIPWRTPDPRRVNGCTSGDSRCPTRRRRDIARVAAPAPAKQEHARAQQRLFLWRLEFLFALHWALQNDRPRKTDGDPAFVLVAGFGRLASARRSGRPRHDARPRIFIAKKRPSL